MATSLRRGILAASLAAALWAGPASACPVCAGREAGGSSNRTVYFLGAMILLPWAVAGTVVVALRKLAQDSPDRED